MRHLLREFIWVLLTTLCLALLPWWQTILIALITTPILLRLTERGFKRRLLMLFLSLAVMLISFHSSRTLVSTAVTKLFRLPHFLLLALLSAGCFSVIIALAAESVLWMKYSFRRINKSKEKIPSSRSFPKQQVVKLRKS
jgi:predicted membrane protein